MLAKVTAMRPPVPAVGIILQARMGSTRLPGKVLRPLSGRPLLAHIVDRLRACRVGERLVLATTDLAQDDALAAFATEHGVECFRGSERDVLDRYYRCAIARGLQHVVRATGDNPFVDPEEADRLVQVHLEGGYDYTSASSDAAGGLPIGVGLEIMTTDALERAWREGHAPHHREHVNEYLLEHPELFRRGVATPPAAKRAPGLRLTVDTPADLAFAERLLDAFARTGLTGPARTEWLVEEARRA